MITKFLFDGLTSLRASLARLLRMFETLMDLYLPISLAIDLDLKGKFSEPYEIGSYIIFSSLVPILCNYLLSIGSVPLEMINPLGPDDVFRAVTLPILSLSLLTSEPSMGPLLSMRLLSVELLFTKTSLFSVPYEFDKGGFAVKTVVSYYLMICLVYMGVPTCWYCSTYYY